MSKTTEQREAGDCGDCTDPSDFDWSAINLPHIDGAVMVCNDHGEPAPGWAYDIPDEVLIENRHLRLIAAGQPSGLDLNDNPTT